MRIVLIVWLELTAGSDARPFRQIPACGGMATLQNIGVQFTIRQKLKNLLKLKKKKIYLISQWKVPNNLALLFYIIIIKHLNAEMNNEDLTHMIAEFLETDTINTVT